MRRIVLILTAALIVPSRATAQVPRALSATTHVDTTLQPGASHTYAVTLRRGESVTLVVEQRGVDVVVEVLDHRDSVLQRIDSPNGRNGPENVEVFGRETGHYTIRVRAFDAREPEGRYSLAVTAWRNAAATRALLASRQLRRDSAATWLRARTAGLDSSPPPLERLAASVTVIGIGEATHGSREFGDLRLRLTRYLVEHMRYRIVALEASASRLAFLDRYARGDVQNRDSAAAVLERGWIGRRPLRELVVWLRQWNADHPTDLVRLVGLDDQDNERDRAELRRFIASAYPEASGRYAGVERELAAADSQTWVFGDSRVDSSARRFLQELGARIDADQPLLQRLVDSTQLGNGATAARRLSRFADFNSADANAWSRNRDWHMTATLLQALAETPGAKAVYWAHNAHVSAPPNPGSAPMGSLLRRALGCGYGALAMTFDSGAFVAQIPNDREDRLAISRLPPAPDETVEGVLRRILPGTTMATWGCADRDLAPNWLKQPQPMHWVGGLYTPGTPPSETFRPIRLVTDFDGIVFVRSVTADEAPADRPLIPARHPTPR